MKTKSDKLAGPIIAILIGGIFCYWMITVSSINLPIRNEQLSNLTALNPSTISSVSAYPFGHASAGTLFPLVATLSDDEIKQLCGMLSKATTYHPQHPQGGSSMLLEVDDKHGIRSMIIMSTSNNGVLIKATSMTHDSTGDTWSQGWLRNDDLATLFDNIQSRAVPLK
jgi:hypothetical protein